MDWTSFLTGALTGAALGALGATVTIGGRYIRALEQLRDVHPADTGPVGEVSVPQATTEQRLAQIGFDEEAVRAFATQLMQDAREVGVTLSWDDAYATAASSMLEGTISET